MRSAAEKRMSHVAFWLLGLGCALLQSATMAVNFPLAWTWSNPLPHGNNIIDIASKNQLWVQVTELGQFYSSTDLAIWVPGTSHTQNSLRAVTFFNDKLLITGESGTVLAGSSPSALNLIDLKTSDWLEGVAASTQVAVAVGD